MNSRFSSWWFKNFFVLFNQEIVMQHFDLYNRSSILITISYLLKFLFREPRFHPSSPSSPLPLKTQDSRIFLLSHWLTSCSSPSRYPIQILLTLWSVLIVPLRHRSWSLSPTKPSAVHRIASTPFALAISSLDSVSSSPSTPGSNRRNCEDSGLHSSQGPPPVLTPSL